MSKPVKKPSTPSAPNKTGGQDFFAYLWRNGLIIAILALFLFSVDKMNERQGKLQEYYQEFSQLRQANANPARQEELYREIIEIQSDTSYLKKITRGYRWAIHDLAFKNLEYIESLKAEFKARGIDSTEQSLYEAKMGIKVGNYPLIQYMVKNTPEDAVILLPPGDSIASDSRWNFLYDPEWTEYFIYPRLCVATGHEDKHPELAKRVTHVLIIKGIGYDKLKYDVPVEQRPSEIVLPINQPPAALSNQ